jgi:hypothetical protein
VSYPLRSIAFWTGLALLLVLSGLGLQSALDLDPPATLGQRVATTTQFGYALAGALAAGALVGRRPWALRVVWVWAGLVTLTGALAPVVWAGSAPAAGVVAGVACGAMAGAVIWLITRRGAGGMP